MGLRQYTGLGALVFLGLMGALWWLGPTQQVGTPTTYRLLFVFQALPFLGAIVTGALVLLTWETLTNVKQQLQAQNTQLEIQTNQARLQTAATQLDVELKLLAALANQMKEIARDSTLGKAIWEEPRQGQSDRHTIARESCGALLDILAAAQRASDNKLWTLGGPWAQYTRVLLNDSPTTRSLLVTHVADYWKELKPFVDSANDQAGD